MIETPYRLGHIAPHLEAASGAASPAAGCATQSATRASPPSRGKMARSRRCHEARAAVLDSPRGVDPSLD